MAEHFKKLNNLDKEEDSNLPETDHNVQNVMLNRLFTEEELSKVVKKLKKNKASGQDGIIMNTSNTHSQK